MFNCYLHGWSSHHYQCPSCTTIETSSTTDVIMDRRYDLHDALLKIDKLEQKLAIAREALDIIANSPDWDIEEGSHEKWLIHKAKQALTKLEELERGE